MMTQFDFTTRPDRTGQLSLKWKASEADPDLLQMWVADMDFLPCPAVKEAVQAYAAEHVYGYAYLSQSLLQSIVDWEKDQHGVVVEPSDLVLIEGVVPAISVAVQALTKEGDSVLINTPVYGPFARTIKLNNRQLITQPLVERQGRFELDLEELEANILRHQVKLYLLCNPHNPGGRVWSREELEAIARLCRKHGVLLVSDEIHQDLTLFGHRHHSVLALEEEIREQVIVLSSATKTFNMAGLKASFVMIPNPELRKLFTRRQLINNHCDLATVGLLATEAAFLQGKPWLEELKQTLEENVRFAVAYLEEHTRIQVMKPEGTYLIWLDFSVYGIRHEEIQDRLIKDAKIVLNDGLGYGREGKYHARLNIATPLASVQEACRRIAKVFGK